MNPASAPAPATITYTRDQFKRPPLVNRRFVTRLDVPADVFDEHALPIIEAVKEEGGFDQPVMKREQWEFRVEFKGKAPRPKVRLTHVPVLTRSAQGPRPRTTLELFPPAGGQPAAFTIDQERSDATASRFEDLESECQRWLTFVMDRLDVRNVGGIHLEYRNEFPPERYPMFWEGENKLLLDRVLWLFQNNPGPGNFVTPLHVEFNLSTELQNDSSILFRMETVPTGKGGFSLAATLAYSSLGREGRTRPDALWPELAKAHELLFQNFGRQFTAAALHEFAR